jgi:peptide/nickel transport system substrate-binding protein
MSGTKSTIVALMLAAGAWVASWPGTGSARAESLTIALSTSITTLDPQISNTVATDLSIASHLYSPLIIRDPDLKMRGIVAEEWRAVDDRTWTFKIRQGLSFPDGEPLDAAAVKWNLERIMNPETRSQMRVFFDPIAAVEATSPTEVKVVTKAAYPVLPQQMALMFLMPPKWTQSHKPAGEALGSGPYDLKEYRAGDRVVLSAKKNYFGEKPVFDEVVLRMVPEASARTAALIAGEIDFALDLPPTDIPRINASGRGQAGWGDSNRTMIVRINTFEPPFKDNKLLRQAISYAIDRKAIINAVYEGHGTESRCQILSPMYFGYNTDLNPYPYDPAKARQLIAAAGAKAPVEVTLDVPLGRYLQTQEIGQILASQLDEAGFKVRINELDYATFSTKYANKQMAQLTFHGQGWPDLDADGLLSLYDTRNATAYWSNPQFDAIIAKGRSTTNEAQRIADYKEATKLMCDESPAAFLFTQPLIYATSKRVSWKARGDDWVRAFDFVRN